MTMRNVIGTKSIAVYSFKFTNSALYLDKEHLKTLGFIN